MGRDERAREAMDRAMLERALGPVRPFGAHQVGCEKCGALAWQVRHCPGKQPLDERRDQCPLMGDHLHLCCQTCGWIITQHCRDSEEGAATAERLLAMLIEKLDPEAGEAWTSRRLAGDKLVLHRPRPAVLRPLTGEA